MQLQERPWIFRPSPPYLPEIEKFSRIYRAIFFSSKGRIPNNLENKLGFQTWVKKSRKKNIFSFHIETNLTFSSLILIIYIIYKIYDKIIGLLLFKVSLNLFGFHPLGYPDKHANFKDWDTLWLQNYSRCDRLFYYISYITGFIEG